MTSNELINKTISIITEYYNNHLQPFLDCLDQNVLWIGPTEGQELRGKDTIMNAFSSEVHQLTFTMGSIHGVCVTPHKAVGEVLLHYNIYTHYPSGNTDLHSQRCQFTWHEKKVRTDSGYEPHWEVAMIHVSNAWMKDRRDNIYPVHYENVGLPIRLVEKPDKFMTIKAEDMSIHRITLDSLLYIETIQRTAKLRVHTSQKTIIVNGTLPDFEKKYPEDLLRAHASFLVNPSQVNKIERFALTLSDGTRLPIPEKKYTAVKRQILASNSGNLA